MSDPVTPNMSLLQPITGVTAGSTANDEFNSNWSTIDQHDHSPGKGVPIVPSAINVNADLPLGNNNLTQARSVQFQIQPSALSGSTDLACLYFTGVDLWANDASGNQIQITSGAAVNATSSGISSGTATASFVSSVLVVNSASNRPANVQGASFLFGNNVVNSKFLTLSPPNAMAADYTLVLPPIPGVNSIMGIDTSGNITGAYTMDNSTLDINGSNQLEVKAKGITQGLLANRATGTTVAAGGVAVSASCGSFSTTAVLGAAITNMSVTITTTGRPVALAFQATDNAGSVGGATSSGVLDAAFWVTRGGTIIPMGELEINLGVAVANTWFVPAGMCHAIDFPAAGTYTYQAYASNLGAHLTFVSGCSLVAYEL